MTIQKVDTIATYPEFRTHLTTLIDSLDVVYNDDVMTDDLKAAKFYKILTSNGLL